MLEAGKTYLYDWGSNITYHYIRDIKDGIPHCVSFNIYRNVLTYDFNNKFKSTGVMGLTEIDSRDMLKIVFKQEVFQLWI